MFITSRNIENWIKGMSDITKTRGIKRLEVTMRDVLDGLEDAASYMNYHSTPEIVEILSIEAPGRITPPQPEIIHFNKINPAKSTQTPNIVDYLIQREMGKLA